MTTLIAVVKRWEPARLWIIFGLLVSTAPAWAQAPPTAQQVGGETVEIPRVASEARSATAARHALDPLEPDEIRLAVALVRQEKQLADSVRFVTVSLNEPAKESILHPRKGANTPREAFLILLDNATGRGYEAVVNLTDRTVTRFEPLPEGTQPPIMIDEFGECEEAIKCSPEFRPALKKRGIDDVSLIMVVAWSAGFFGNEPAEDRGKRLSRALSWIRSEPNDNGYARPIEGLVAIVDLNKKEVVRVEDYGVVPLPPRAGNWARSYLKETREGLKPLPVMPVSSVGFLLRPDGFLDGNPALDLPAPTP